MIIGKFFVASPVFCNLKLPTASNGTCHINVPFVFPLPLPSVTLLSLSTNTKPEGSNPALVTNLVVAVISNRLNCKTEPG